MLLSEYLSVSENFNGKRLNQILDFSQVQKQNNKGSLGNAFEVQIFNKAPDNKSEADLDFFIDEYYEGLLDYYNQNINIELKVTAAKQLKNGEYRAKERLVLSMINYMENYPDNLTDSHLYSKIKLMLIIYYLYEPGIEIAEYKVLTHFFNNLDEQDISILERDYKTIIKKLRNGEAHLLSGSDTFYLEACTKSSNSDIKRKQLYSDDLAKPRAFALKNSYMSTLLNQDLSKSKTKIHKDVDDLEYIDKKLRPLIGKTLDEIIALEKLEFSTKSKQFKPTVIRKVLNVKHNDMRELAIFKNANIEFKCVSAYLDGKKKEDINYNAMLRPDIIYTDWEDSDLYEVVNKMYFYCVFIHDRKNPKQSPIFAGYIFRGFTDVEIEEARILWEDVKTKIVNTTTKIPTLPKASDKKLFFLRTKGQNSTISNKEIANGVKMPTRNWWLQTSVLNSEIIKPVLDKYYEM